MKNNPQELKIINILRPAIEDLGFRLVMLEFQSGILQILAEDSNGQLGIDDCTKINRVISPLLEVEDPIPGAYTLEISSPGIDRPLITGDDFNRFIGFEAKVELDMPLESGQKRFRGPIIGSQDGLVKLLVDNAEHTLELNNLRRARLILTDELIKVTKKQLADKRAALAEQNTEQQPTA